MYSESTKLKLGSDQAGFTLLETIIAIAISSSVVLLLVSTLNGLSRSQERMNIALKGLNADVYDDVFLRSLFEGIRPVYLDDEARFVGTPYRIDARSFVSDWSPPAGDRFAMILNDGADTGATLTLRGRTEPLPGLSAGDYQFQYVDHFGRISGSWGDDLTGQVDKEMSILALFSAPVPRQVRIVRQSGSEVEIVFALNISAFDWPSPRPEDGAMLAGVL